MFFFNVLVINALFLQEFIKGRCKIRRRQVLIYKFLNVGIFIFHISILMNFLGVVNRAVQQPIAQDTPDRER